MYDEYIAKAQRKIDSKFGDKKQACALLLQAITLLKAEVADLKAAAQKPAAKKPAAKKPAAKKPAAKKTAAKKTAAKK